MPVQANLSARCQVWLEAVYLWPALLPRVVAVRMDLGSGVQEMEVEILY